MCEHGDTVILELPIVGDIRCGSADIDRCIAPIIKAMNAGGIITKACCCGHGKVMGYIQLADGRYLGVFPNRRTIMKHRHEKLMGDSATGP